MLQQVSIRELVKLQSTCNVNYLLFN